MKLPFVTESGDNFEETPVIGGFTRATASNDFDDVFEEAVSNLDDLTNGAINFRENLYQFIQNPDAISAFKDNLLSGIAEESANSDDPYISSLYNACSQLYDNTVEDLYKESVQVGTLLPVKAVDLPLVIKSHIKTASNMIINSKVTPSPVIKKQIERTWIVDKETGKRYQYPQCLFSDEYKDIYSAGKGLPIKKDPQKLPLFNFDIVDKLTDATIPSREHITFDIQIVKGVLSDGTEVPFKRPIRVNMADGSWVGGVINQTVPKKGGSDGETVEVNDALSGYVDFSTNTCSLTSASGQITDVVFSGYLSNEKNERDVTFDYDREDMEWKVEDGFRADASYSLETLMDAKALVNEDLYKKTYNNLNDLLVHMEDNKTLEFLDEEFEKFDGLELDPLDFNSFISHDTFNCDSTIATVALQSEYIANMLKFRIDRFVIAMADKAKLEDITFVIYGNPRYISLLDPNVNWVVRNGDRVGGVKMNYSYGVMNSGDCKIQVVSVMKLNAKKYDKLRFVAFPTNDTTITFEHYKYATHIATSQNSAYRDPDLPGGAQTYLMGTSRYKNISIQGIQGDMAFDNCDFIGL